MKVRVSGTLMTMACLLGFGLIGPSIARAVPASVDLVALRSIQTFNDKMDDHAYALVTGIVQGKELAPELLPKEGTWTLNRKKMGIDPAKPLTLWSGDLADGEFAQLTVTLFAGQHADEAKLKEFEGKLADAKKKVVVRSAAKIASEGEFTKLATETLKADHELIVGIKELFSREKKTDHYTGQFTIAVWNHGGKIVDRIDPVGLTFGEHFGNKEKIYSKIKYTRQNVLVKDDTGDWAEQQLLPVTDDETTVRVKMEESERIDDVKKVTDYLADLQVKSEGKPVLWQLGGEKLGVDDIHHYWEWAESKEVKPKKAK